METGSAASVSQRIEDTELEGGQKNRQQRGDQARVWDRSKVRQDLSCSKREGEEKRRGS